MWQNRGRTGYSIVGTRLEPPEHGYSLHGAFMVLTMHYASAYCTHKGPTNYLIDTQPAMAFRQAPTRRQAGGTCLAWVWPVCPAAHCRGHLANRPP